MTSLPERREGTDASTPGGDEQVALAPRLATIVASGGQSWRERRRELRPDYRRVWRDLAFCHAMLALGVGAQAVASTAVSATLGWVTAPVAALWIGYWLAALALFGHEAGHSNLAASRRWNDRIGDWLVWSLFGQSVRGYRRSHWQHHLHLGGLGDTEISYRNCLATGFLARAATGLQALAVLGRYGAVPDVEVRSPAAPEAPWRERAVPALRSVLLHGSILGALVVAGLLSTAAAWGAATVVVFPFLGAVRQVLEHRPFGIDCDADLAALDEGAVNRMFGTDF